MDVECCDLPRHGCSACKCTGWIEILGCGMVHPGRARERRRRSASSTPAGPSAWARRASRMARYGIPRHPPALRFRRALPGAVRADERFACAGSSRSLARALDAERGRATCSAEQAPGRCHRARCAMTWRVSSIGAGGRGRRSIPNSDQLSVTKVDAGSGDAARCRVRRAERDGGEEVSVRAARARCCRAASSSRSARSAAQISNGMLCSARELGLGRRARRASSSSTPTPRRARRSSTRCRWPTSRIVVDVTPNRPDLLSHLGLARELAARDRRRDAALPEIAGVGAVVVPEPVHHAGEATAGGVRVTLEDPAGCPRYMGVVIRGVKVGPSPAWLVERLTAVGQPVDQQRGGRHQLPAARARPADARVRRVEARGAGGGRAPRARGRDAHHARRHDARARRES